MHRTKGWRDAARRRGAGISLVVLGVLGCDAGEEATEVVRSPGVVVGGTPVHELSKNTPTITTRGGSFSVMAERLGVAATPDTVLQYVRNPGRPWAINQ